MLVSLRGREQFRSQPHVLDILRRALSPSSCAPSQRNTNELTLQHCYTASSPVAALKRWCICCNPVDCIARCNITRLQQIHCWSVRVYIVSPSPLPPLLIFVASSFSPNARRNHTRCSLLLPSLETYPCACPVSRTATAYSLSSCLSFCLAHARLMQSA